tara:strand:+ start:2342 stop:3529 length:1188 start_codon:yes stop_codon:yes gene_type:complete
MKFNIVDLFCGSGGLSDGFLQTKGFNTLALIDWDQHSINTIKKRLSDKWGYRNTDRLALLFDLQRVTELLDGYKDKIYGESEGLRKIVGNQQIDFVIGGPPCQAYSIAGRVQDKDGMQNDYRNYLFESFIHIVNEFRPKAFVFENVMGILSAKPGGIHITDRIKGAFDQIGYAISSNLRENALFDMSFFGIPQVRKRVIIFGVPKENKNELDTFYRHLWGYKNPVQEPLKNYLSDLPKIYPINPDGKRISHLTESGTVIKNHIPRFHNERDVKIFQILADDIVKGKGKYKSTQARKDLYKTFTNRNSNFHKHHVLELNKPSNTIPAHLYKDGLRHIHPDPYQARSITPREAARLQTFSDDFEFIGPMGEQYKMIGNAVPPKFARLIANTILKLYP